MAATVFLGSIGRVVSLMLDGAGPKLFVAFIAIELVGAPSVLAWHASGGLYTVPRNFDLRPETLGIRGTEFE